MGANQTWAKILGIVLLLVGIIGIFAGDTLLGFQLNPVHNWVHILSGLIALFAGFSGGGHYAKTYNVVFGIVYLLVAILGFAGIAAVVDLLALNAADNWLHALIGVITTATGIWAS